MAIIKMSAGLNYVTGEPQYNYIDTDAERQCRTLYRKGRKFILCKNLKPCELHTGGK